MKLIAAVKLRPNPAQAASLSATLLRCNAACTSLAAEGFAAGTFRQFDLHKLAYGRLRSELGLSAQAAVRSIAKVADAFKVSRDAAPIFRPLASQPYDDRIMRFTDKGNAVSLWTVDGRVVVPVVMGEHQRRLMQYRKGEADLCFVRGKWVLACTCEVPETNQFNAEDWLGVDLGIVQIATDSDGVAYSGAAVEKVRAHLGRRRGGLQKKGTKAAKRKLRKLSGQQRRFHQHVNHEISKALVLAAERTGRGIALEELRGIRDRVTAKRSQRARLHNWSFNDLRAKIAYKAHRAGVPVVYVDPRYTSIGCSCCGVIDKKNRPDQATF